MQKNQIRELIIDFNSINEHFICGICRELVIEPRECGSCQHLFCGECITNWLKIKSVCPFCRQTLKNPPEPHRFVRNTIQQIKVKCKNPECTTITTLENFDYHIKQCEYSKFNCQNQGCSVSMKKIELNEHSKICEYRIIQCEKCDANHKFNQAHDCIAYLQEIVEKQEEEIKKKEDLLLQSKNNQQKFEQQIIQLEKAKKFEIPLCDKGHFLAWAPLKGSNFCGKCRNSSNRISYRCDLCQINLCLDCIKPVFNFRKCPGNHDLIFQQADEQICCSFCRQKPFENKISVWSDRACDYDVCNNCFIQLSQ